MHSACLTRFSTVALSLFVLSACTGITKSAYVSQPIEFVVIGDTPYDNVDIEMLDRALPMVTESAPPFVIHVGDYKGGKSECNEEHDLRHQALIASLSPIPVFYTPGDNEWTDCDRGTDPNTGEHYSELRRLDRLRRLFFSDLPPNAERFLPKQQSALPENMMWIHQGVRFATLHVSGTNNGRDWVNGDPLSKASEAAAKRDEANLNWIDSIFREAVQENAAAIVIAFQANVTKVEYKPADIMCTFASESDDHPCDAYTDIRLAIQELSVKFQKPVLVIHGDTDDFTLDQTFSGEEAPNLWRLDAAGDAGPADQANPDWGQRDVTHVSINLASDTPFSARGVLTGILPKSE